MASPQKEDGYTPLANEIMDALCRTNFASYDRRVLDCVLRKTYGWNKKEDFISLSQFQEATQIPTPNICRSLRCLIKRNMVITTKDGHVTEYQFQKDYTLWDKPLSLQTVPAETVSLQTVSVETINTVSTDNQIVSTDNKTLSLQTDTKDIKDTITKDIIQKTGAISKKSNKSVITLPEWIPLESWNGYLDMRKAKKKLPTDHAIKLLIDHLTKFHDDGQDVKAILERSIVNSWTDVYSLDNHKNTSRKALPTDDELERSWFKDGK